MTIVQFRRCAHRDRRRSRRISAERASQADARSASATPSTITAPTAKRRSTTRRSASRVGARGRRGPRRSRHRARRQRSGRADRRQQGRRASARRSATISTRRGCRAQHNDANVLSMGGRIVAFGLADEILALWLETPFEGGRHQRRLDQIRERRANNHQGSIGPATDSWTLRHARRSRSGNRRRDPQRTAPAEQRPRADRLRELRQPRRARSGRLGAHEQVRRGLSRPPLLRRLRVRRRRRARWPSRARRRCSAPSTPTCSRTRARRPTWRSTSTLLKPGDTVLGMNLAHGGHLTHGHPLNFSGKLYTIVPYGVRQDDERIDYDELDRLADEHKPKMIIVGASAYPRVIDFAAHPRGRRPHRRRRGDRHGAHRRPRRRRRPSESRAALRLRHDDDAQDAARAAGGHGALPRAVREGSRQARLSRRAGRSADAHHRGQGRLLQGSGRAGVRRLSAADRRQRERGSPARCRRRASASSAAAPTTT